MLVERAQVQAVGPHRAAGRVVEAGDQLHHRRLARSRLPDEREWEKAARMAGTLEELGALREWTNSWQNGARVLRSGEDPAARLFAGEDLARVGFRIVRGMTGR